MTKKDAYLQALSALDDWEPYLRQESGLPGPRGNLELASAAADLIRPEQIEKFISDSPEIAPENTPGCFVVFCGVVGLGELAARGNREALPRLRHFASDPRWRIREGVAMGLQRLGRADMPRLLDEMDTWCAGNWLEMRAAAAALAEPDLLRQVEHTRRVLGMMDTITALMQLAADRKSEDFKILRQGMAYCWSVAVAALPPEGKTAMEEWLKADDPDIRWMMKENLKKNRLQKMDATWVQDWSNRIR